MASTHAWPTRRPSTATFGGFDAVASLGAFEHFCSPDEYFAGRQEDVYRDLFAKVATVLPGSGRFYLQTMVFGRNMIPPEEVDIDAPRDSDAWYLALMQYQFPGSFLPFGQEQIVRTASRTSAWSRAPAADSTTSRRSSSGAGGSVNRASGRRCSRCASSRAG